MTPFYKKVTFYRLGKLRVVCVNREVDNFFHALTGKVKTNSVGRFRSTAIPKSVKGARDCNAVSTKALLR